MCTGDAFDVAEPKRVLAGRRVPRGDASASAGDTHDRCCLRSVRAWHLLPGWRRGEGGLRARYLGRRCQRRHAVYFIHVVRSGAERVHGGHGAVGQNMCRLLERHVQHYGKCRSMRRVDGVRSRLVRECVGLRVVGSRVRGVSRRDLHERAKSDGVLATRRVQCGHDRAFAGDSAHACRVRVLRGGHLLCGRHGAQSAMPFRDVG